MTGAKGAGLLFAAALLALAANTAGASAGQDVKQDAKTVGHGIGNGARDVGHGTANAARTVGHGTANAARTVGHGTAHVAKSIGHGARQGWNVGRVGRGTGRLAAGKSWMS